MHWYVAHCVMLMRFRDGPQDAFTGYENMFLLRANSFEDANLAAEARARQDESWGDPSLESSGRPAVLVFAGVRKVVAVEGDPAEITSGVEVSYNDVAFDDETAFQKFVNGDEVNVTIQ